MRSKQRLSVKRFERQHPGLAIKHKTLDGGLLVVYARKPDGTPYAAANGKKLHEALFELSEACYKLSVLDAADRQGWKSDNTGEVGKPLQGHHQVKRSAGRNDSAQNLSAVTVEVHSHQHELKSLPRKGSEHR